MPRQPSIVKRCGGCPLFDQIQVPSEGPTSPKFIVIAESPGRNEEREKRPLIGESGQIFMGALAKIGVKREDVYLCNTISCWPKDDKDSIMPAAVAACRPRLIAELRRLPKVPILLLGKWAASSFLSADFKIMELMGSYHEIVIPELADRGPYQMIPTLHPAAILHGGKGEGGGGAHSVDLLFWNILYDTGKVAKLADGVDLRLQGGRYVETRNSERADKLVERVCAAGRRAKKITVDTETVGVKKDECRDCYDCQGHEAVDAMHARLTAIGLATEEYAVSVAWSILWPRTRARIRALLADRQVATVFHNRIYDMVVLERNGFPVLGDVRCTFFAHHNAFPGFNHKLQRVVSQFYAVPPWKSEFRHGQGSIKELCVYNAQDTLGTAAVHPRLEVMVKKNKTEKAYEMDLKMAEIAERMQLWGVPVDLDVNAELGVYLERYCDERKTKLAAALDDPAIRNRFFEVMATEKAMSKRKKDSDDYEERVAVRRAEVEKRFKFNLNAKTQVAALLIASGIPLFERTKKSGQLSTAKLILEGFGRHPVARAIRDHGTADKLLGTFVKPVPRMLDRERRAHPEWSPKDITGRWASSPNWQNLAKGHWPKKSYAEWLKLPDAEKRMPNMRAQVVAPEGRVLIGADFAQLEMRIIAQYSGEPNLLKAFRDKVDVHSEISRMVYANFDGMDPDKRSRARDHMKRGEYGYSYKAAPETVHKKFIEDGYDIQLATIRKMYAILGKQWPQVTAWHKAKYARAVRDRRLTEPLLGRTRQFLLGRIEETVVANFDVQAMAGSLMDIGLDRFYSQRPESCFFLINGHDSLVVEEDEDRAEETAKLMVECLEQEYTYNGITMRYPVEWKIGKSWDVV